jgi:3'-5' exoribonuclease
MFDNFFGRVMGINTNDDLQNLLIQLSDGTRINVKAEPNLTDGIKVNMIYNFEIEKLDGREILKLISHKKMEDFSGEEIDRTIKLFEKGSDFSFLESELIINEYIEKIKNKAVYEITKKIVFENADRFYTYAAGTKLHHAYVGGLVSHTIGMLRIADSILDNFSYLDSDYLYSGVILHDVGKIHEFSGVLNPEYAVKGQLLGHLVIGGIMIESAAKELGYENLEETMILQHMVISHHGQPQFGAAKRPMTAEALVLWYIDALDSKLRVLGDELDKTEDGAFTENIAVLDRLKYYKPIK